MTRREDKAKLRRQLNDRLARVDQELDSRLDVWDRPVPVHLFGSAKVEASADVMAEHS